MMRVAGIDVGARSHQVAVLDEHEKLVLKPTAFTEDAEGYQRLFELLERAAARGGEDLPLAAASGDGRQLLVVMEATGHYWLNLYAALNERGYAVAVINPLRTSRFAGEELARTKSDSIDCAQLARFGVQKRPAPTLLGDALDEELREMMRLRTRLVQDRTEQINRLHRLINLGFPELTRHLKDLGSQLAIALLCEYPTAQALRGIRPKRLARLCYDGRHTVGEQRARELIEAAKVSVGSQHSAAHQRGVRYACEDLATLNRRLEQLDSEIADKLASHPLGQLLITIDGIGVNTAAHLIAELGDPARFSSAAALAAYVGLCPAHRSSGTRNPKSAALTSYGNRKLRRELWMPTLGAATRSNPWLMAFYNRLIENGKPHKLALIAAMRKLLGAIYSVAKHRRPFVPFLNHPNFIALSAAMSEAP